MLAEERERERGGWLGGWMGGWGGEVGIREERVGGGG